ncbi:SAF domain-containing protein [Chelatococcus asaccharovorans]|uniref:SAF domain-containing protein n=2 Tax=Chelatococcus asaccharovorans TaxID=28210 RepID=A0A2V3UIC0_9HYPH|nr:SAF domain-containing protein [Chelatococcus asaccharovorans]
MMEAERRQDHEHDERVILLGPDDNVVVVRRRIDAGSLVRIGGRDVSQPKDIPLGHKLASRSIRRGEKIIKYGAPIGSATADIGPGEHVHVHNMKSDYTATHTLDEARARHGDVP